MEFHYYDFERDPQLLEKLKLFVSTVKSKNMQKWLASIHRTLQKVCNPSSFQACMRNVTGNSCINVCGMSVTLVSMCVGCHYGGLIPRPSLTPVFDCFQCAKTEGEGLVNLTT